MVTASPETVTPVSQIDSFGRQQLDRTWLSCRQRACQWRVVEGEGNRAGACHGGGSTERPAGVGAGAGPGEGAGVGAGRGAPATGAGELLLPPPPPQPATASDNNAATSVRFVVM
jgi:hypothetical protein